MYLLALLLSALAALPSAQAQRRPAAPPAAPAPFKTPLTAAQMANKQAVVQTTAGTFVIDLRPDLAPNHVGYFMKLAGEGAYANTAFHRVVRDAIIQGGDPLSKDPCEGVAGRERRARRAAGGAQQRAVHARRGRRGAAAGTAGQRRRAVLRVRHRSAGARRGSSRSSAASAKGSTSSRRSRSCRPTRGERPRRASTITAVTIRDTPPPEPIPFANDTPEQLARIAPCSRPPSGRSPSGSCPAWPRSTCATSCSSRRRACSTAPRSTASCAASSCRRGALDTRASAHRKTAEARSQPSAGVQRHEARQGHRVHGARRRSRQRHHFILHCHGGRAIARRQIHRLRPDHRRPGRPRRIESTPVSGESPTTRIDLIKVRIAG